MQTRKLFLIIIFLPIIFITSALHAQDDWKPPRTAEEWMTNPVRGAVVEIGQGKSDELEYPPYPSVESFKQMYDLGARVTLIQAQILWTTKPPYEPLEEQFTLLEEALDNATEAGLYIIVGIRNGPGTNALLSDVPDEDIITSLYQSEDVLDSYNNMLKDVVGRLQERPEIIAWEPLIEPNLNRYLFDYESSPYPRSAAIWNIVAEEMIGAIREVDPDRPILIPSVDSGTQEGFINLKKFDDENIIYTLHQYEPYPYTSQSEEPYTGYPGEYYGIHIDREVLEDWFKPVEDFQKEYEVPIVVGEWGGIRWIPDMAEYYTDQVEMFEERGWSWLYYTWYDPYWEERGFEAQWGIDPDEPTYDPHNPVFEAVIEGWQKNHID